MAKTLKQLENGIRIKFLVKAKKYFLFWGSQQCVIDGKYQDGFKTEEEAEKKGNILIGKDYYKHSA